MLDRLKQYREFILLSEILALLHDLGKVNDPVDDRIPYQNHLPVLHFEMGLGDYLDECDQTMVIRDPEQLKYFRLFARTKWSELEIDIPDGYVELNEEIGYTSIKHHYKKKKKNKPDLRPTTLIQNIIAQADNMDSSEDRVRRVIKYYKNSEAMQYKSVHQCTPFGSLVTKEESFLHRVQFYQELGEILNEDSNIKNIIGNRKLILKNAKKYWRYAPAMSLYPDNDTSVWDHCFGTSSIAKAILAGALLHEESMLEFCHLVYEMAGKLSGHVYYLLTFESDISPDELNRLICEKSPTQERQIGDKTNNFTAKFASLYGREHFIGKYRGKNDYNAFALIEVKERKQRNSIRKYVNQLFFDHIKDHEKVSIVKINNKYTCLDLFEQDSTSVNQICLLDCLIGLPNVLAIQYSGRDFRTRVYRTQDFLGRNKKLDEIIDEVTDLIEEDLAIGNLVYKDVNGIYFIVPSPAKLEGYASCIEDTVIKIFNSKSDGEILPMITFAPCKLTGKSLNFGHTVVELKKKYETNCKKRLPDYHVKKFPTELAWEKRWEAYKKKEICDVCGRRPANSTKKLYLQEKLCEWCEENRGIQAKDKSNASFISQICDENNKVALLIGDFGLFDLWLSGQYVMTNTNGKYYKYINPKLPSPSRLRSIIANNDHFLDAIRGRFRKDKTLMNLSVKVTAKLKSGIDRVERGYFVQKMTQDKLEGIIRVTNKGQDPNYEIQPKDESFIHQVLITGQSIGIYVDRVDEANSSFEGRVIARIPSIYKTPENSYSTDWVRRLFTNIFKNNLELVPDRERTRKVLDHNDVDDIDVDVTDGQLAIQEIYSMADEFMWLVPASEVANIVKIFETEFDRYFNKARGRLSLNLGSLFFDQKYPLYLVLDAAQRMLKEFREFAGRNMGTWEDGYKVTINNAVTISAMGYPAEVVDNVNTGGQAQLKLKFKTGMYADSVREYVYDLETEVYKDRKNEDKYFTKAIVLSSDSSGTLKNIKNLQPGDQILFTPNIFDFQQITSAEDRLCIALPAGEEYSRRENPTCNLFSTRPMLMEDLQTRFGALARTLTQQNVAKSALHNLQEQVIHFAKTLDSDDQSSRELLKEYCEMLLGNISNLGSVSLAGLDIVEFITDGSFFDLLELMLRHRVFDRQTEGGDGDAKNADC